MKLTQVKGNTYVLEGRELIPLYKTDDTHCILMDTGLWHERDKVEESLVEHQLIPTGIISTHMHPDHSANDRYFQEKYHLPVALPAGEAELCADYEAIKDYFQVPSVEEAGAVLTELLLHPDQLIAREDSTVELSGVTFQVMHTPGHSPDHISLITPDGVCYVGDALLSGKMLEAKVPCNYSHQATLDSFARLPDLDCDQYILAHHGIYDDISDLVAANRHLILDRTSRILSLITHPMCEEEIYTAAFEHFSISYGDPSKLLMVGHNVQSYLSFLVERGELEEVTLSGTRCYQRTAR